MFFRRRKYHYTLPEVKGYISDLEKIEKMRAAVPQSPSAGKVDWQEYSKVLHVMREVLLHMVGTLRPDERLEVEQRVNTILDPKEGK